jgi:F-type H+-transporting ATPase subunit b
MLNEKFWLAIAFFSFVAIILKKFSPNITKALDDKSKAIAQDILLAKEARNEAEKILASAKQIHENTIENAKKLIADADNEAKVLLNNASEILNNEIARMTALASQRIKNEEEATIRQIKTKILYSALLQFQDSSKISNEEHQKIIDNSVKNFERIH